MRVFWITAVIALAAGPPAAAQVAPAPAGGRLDAGVRGTLFDDGSDRARFERYRDLRDGPYVNGVRWNRDSGRWLVGFEADHVGYRDQRFRGSLNLVGRLKLSFEWDQIPLFFSEDTRTLYSSTSAGTFLLGDALQSGLQARTLTPPGVASRAQGIETRLRRDIADVRLSYSASPDVTMTLGLKNTSKDGAEPWGATFGFGNAVELPVPISTTTTDVDGGLEWTRNGALVRVGYDGSFFRNDVSALVWDNPLIAGRLGDRRLIARPHGALARQRSERRQRHGRNLSAGPQPGDGVCLAWAMVAKRSPDSRDDQ